MSALVNANTRVGMGHTTRAQRSMLAAKESARQRHDDARAFLDPMRRNLSVAGETLHGWTVVAFIFLECRALA